MKSTKPLILIADDEAAIRELMEAALGSEYRVLLARDGQQAKNFFKQFGARIDAVVTDAEMPILDGVALTSWLLGQAQPPPVILMSGSASQTSQAARDLWHRSPGVSWLEKPFAVQHLHEAISHRLRHAKSS